ncbi:ATP-binding cassette domain-containing protein [Roseospira goensis]|uniref:ABC-type nitrate/sulfonate/bicarbonate transport system ATPase subunit/ABC-type transporter Mla maintaining outer membrane lipid asymmetry permease subunit MlaE n=1 Tax=Roseospira goensis TaxID=391922 RepID=A0A7W6S290_9PROT|nr:ATP-binding cassette domain-containing protein [Roseospira goensis]MBB4287543.1 ABC-type nitrate/sulfonate/bicarbonate transport system ATPase subunit/ABC-type transporter Mla maintaining outer membrane lipid asymmetry permease subunit MlaE [Roseospira goensis]
MTAAPALSVAGLTLATPDGRPLLEDAAFAIGAGEIVLLTGPSGCGKSTLLRLLAGLGRPGDASAGYATTPGGGAVDLARDPAAARFGAMVFQSLGLFEDLTIAENLAIVADHGDGAAAVAGGPDPARAVAHALLDGLPPDGSPRQLSGGQQQRVAIARTVLADRPVLLFDEPNAGLDVAAGRELAGLIARVARELGRGVLIVAHHLEPFLPYAGQVLFMDPAGRALERLPPERAVIEARLLAAAAARRATAGTASDDPPAPAATATAAPAGAATADARRVRRRWFGRYLRSTLWSLALCPAALAYMGLAAVLVGFVTTWFTVQTMPYRAVLSPLILNDVLAGLGALHYRVLVPLLTGILLASRAGAIVAADMGHRVHAAQILAMRNLGVPDRLYLRGAVTATVVAAALAYALVLFGLAALTSERTFALLLDPGGGSARWWGHFFGQLVDAEHWIPRGTGWLLLKMTLSGAVIAGASLRAGLAPKTTGLDINDGISTAVTTALGGVLVIHALVALVEFGL